MMESLKHKEAVERILDNAGMAGYLRDAVIAHWDQAMALERRELCRLRNRLSGLVARIESVKEAA